MALNSINTPLAFVGQEWVFLQTYTEAFNLTSDQVIELFAGPAFLPWNRMGNIRSWMVRLYTCLAPCHASRVRCHWPSLSSSETCR
jgi:hypothetical protein